MSGLLLDTNVLSEILKRNPNRDVMERLRQADQNSLYTSVICVFELRYGAARHSKPQVLWQRILDEVLSLIRVLPLEQDDAVQAGVILADLASRGETVGIEDVLIAATAQNRNLLMITRNTRHLGRIAALKVENWWQP